MDLFDQVLKKYSLYFPHLPTPSITKNTISYTVQILNCELEIQGPSELDTFIDNVVKCVSINCRNKKEETVAKNKSQNQEKKNQNNVKKHDRSLINNGSRNNIKKDTRNNNTKKESANNIKQSARGKMKVKNIQNNRYVPTYQEDTNSNQNNILTECKESFSEKISKYCNTKNLAYPEYVFEKSNGVYLCRAMFMKEKFESRYAYDVNVAKEDASSLIYSFIKYQETSENENKRVRVDSTQNDSLNTTVQNTNYSEMFSNTDNENTFDIGKFLQFN